MAKAIENRKAPAQSNEKKEKAAKEKKDQLPFGKRFAVVVAKTEERFTKAMKKVAALPDETHEKAKEAKQQLQFIVGAFGALKERLNALPDDFSPKGAKSEGGSRIEVGGTVTVREKKRADYDGLIDAKELEGMKVLAIKGNKALVQVASGSKIFMPKSHLAQVKAV